MQRDRTPGQRCVRRGDCVDTSRGQRRNRGERNATIRVRIYSEIAHRPAAASHDQPHGSAAHTIPIQVADDDRGRVCNHYTRGDTEFAAAIERRSSAGKVCCAN